LLESLYDFGDEEYALHLMTQQSDRSWARWIYEFGATNTLESWGPEYKPNLDWSHPWGAAPASIIPRKLMGIEPLEPGYGKIRIKPQPGNLEKAELKLTTIKGVVKVSFLNVPDAKFELNVSIPANMKADIYLPQISSNSEIKMNGEKIPFKKEGEFVVVKNVGSGVKTFLVSAE
jgi:hypothetical protein